MASKGIGGIPFNKIEYETVVIQLMIHLTKTSGKAIPIRICSKKTHYSESYAFCISIFIIHIGDIPFLP